MSLNRRIRRHVVLRNHAKCIESIYAEEIGAAAICENGSGQTISVRQPGGVAAAIEVVQRPSSSHLMVQLAQVCNSRVQSNSFHVCSILLCRNLRQ